MKAFFPIFLTLVLLVTVLVPQSGIALTLTQLEQQLKKIKAEDKASKLRIKKLENEMYTVKIEKNKKTKERLDLEAKVRAADEEIFRLEKHSEEVEVNLAESKQQLAEAVLRIEERDGLLQHRLRLMYTNGAVSYMEVLLSSTSFSDFLDRFYNLQALVGQDKEILESNKRDHEEVAVQTASIEAQLIELISLYEQQKEAKDSYIALKKATEVTIASLEKKEEQLSHYSEEETEQMLKNAAKIAQLQNEIEKMKVYYKGGKIGYPLPKVYRVSSNFGGRTDPITGRKGAWHNGIDFAAPGGTSILAAEAGRVITAGWVRGYGNTVILDHGNGLWTLYAHARSGGIKVKVGDEVKKLQKISEVGTTGNSTGNHLHFEVRLNQKAVDPRGYLNL